MSEKSELVAGSINVASSDSIGWIELANPDRLNAISLGMWREVMAALAAFGSAPAVRCIIFTGQGSKAFCVGADVAEKERNDAAAPDRPAEQRDRTALDALEAIERCPKPTIAMVRGYCLGAGLAIAAACDLRFAEPGARFGIPAARLALPLYYVGLRRLMDLVGVSNAKRIVFTAERFDAAQALRFGLVDELVPAEQLDRSVRGIANAIAANAPLTVAAAKHAAAQVLLDPQERDYAAIAANERMCLESADHKEGLRAFLEKRPPRFCGA